MPKHKPIVIQGKQHKVYQVGIINYTSAGTVTILGDVIAILARGNSEELDSDKSCIYFNSISFRQAVQPCEFYTEVIKPHVNIGGELVSAWVIHNGDIMDRCCGILGEA